MCVKRCNHHTPESQISANWGNPRLATRLFLHCFQSAFFNYISFTYSVHFHFSLGTQNLTGSVSLQVNKQWQKCLKAKLLNDLAKFIFIHLSHLPDGDKANKPFWTWRWGSSKFVWYHEFLCLMPDAGCIAILHVSREFVRHAQTFINWC